MLFGLLDIPRCRDCYYCKESMIAEEFDKCTLPSGDPLSVIFYADKERYFLKGNCGYFGSKFKPKD